MTLIEKPTKKPARPEFSSGPCAKRPGWDVKNIINSCYLGRSHRAREAKLQIKKVINMSKELLEIPEDYKVGLVPASNTGAFEMAMWTLLGKSPVDIFSWEKFGLLWASDIIDQLKIKDYRLLKSDYGLLPDINSVREGCDLCFTLNGTTSGVRVPNLDWIPLNRDGLVLCDATSAVFAQKIEWNKVDATTFSWQKSMGGEGAHGMLVLSPKAIKRLEEYTPERPLPKIFRLVKNGKLIEEIFSGDTINTPSMFCVADALDSLNWIKALGGLDVTVARATKNFETLQAWLNTQDWIKNLVGEETHRSTTSVCLKIVAKEFLVLSEDKQRQFVKYFVSLLENERVAFDIAGHREAPPGLRIWCGATIENEDLQRLLPWLEWAFTCAKLMFVKT